MSGTSREELLSMIRNLPPSVKPSVTASEPVNADGSAPTSQQKTGNLKAEFEKAMGGDFDFKGSFAYSGTFPQAPNPVLSVEGVGLIGLPLSERDAQLLINASARAPYGHNDQTIVNPEVRDTWEIEPAKIVFKNPAWATFVQSQVLSSVTKKLGTGAAQTRCELYKLLLYQEGSHFHRHQDTAKSPGMFATIIVILPSMYTGGQVHVSHSASYEVFDFAAQSLLSTVALAWYTDVFHEVKPVTSGYRLALSYNVIKDPTALAIPRLPDMSGASEELRRVLEAWKAKRYAKGNQELIAYILEHQYSTYELDQGLASLKGTDAHRLVHIDEVAADLGFEIYLANLEYHLHGAADDDGGGYHKRGRYYDDESDEDDDGTPGMLEVYERTLKATNLVDLEGIGVGFSELKLKMAQLVPSDPFNGKEPDDTEYEGYMGNGAGELDQYYHRTVMIIVHEDDSISAFTAGDPNGSYGFHRLKKSMTALSDTPTQDDIKLANVVIKNLQPHQKNVATTLLSYAVCWKDAAMWKRLAVWLNHDLNVDAISEAWKAFGFEAIREILEPVVAKSKTFSEKMNWLDKFKGLVYPDETLAVREWRVKQRMDALSTLKNPTTSDVAVIVKLIQEYGAGWFDTKIYSNIAKDDAMYSFWVLLSRELYKVKDTLPHSDGETLTESAPTCTSDGLVDKCIQTATSLWEVTVAAPYLGYYRAPNNNGNPPQVERIIQLVDLYICTERVSSCQPLFIDLLKNKPFKRDTFDTIYKSLTVRLRETLGKRNLSVCDAPFVEIMQLLVGFYLHLILGTKPKPVNMRTVGCGCSDCGTLNSFLNGQAETQTLLLLKKQKDHLVGKLWLAKDLLEFDIIERGRPQPLVLKRSKAVIAVRQWPRKQAEAKAFLQSVGNDDVIGRLLGARYADMLRAVEGTKRFALPVYPPVPVDGAQVPVADAGQVAGKKRKQPAVIDGPVIDLTSD